MCEENSWLLDSLGCYIVRKKAMSIVFRISRIQFIPMLTKEWIVDWQRNWLKLPVNFYGMKKDDAQE